MFGLESGRLRGQSRILIRDRWPASTDSNRLSGPFAIARLAVSICSPVLVYTTFMEFTVKPPWWICHSRYMPPSERKRRRSSLQPGLRP